MDDARVGDFRLAPATANLGVAITTDTLESIGRCCGRRFGAPDFVGRIR